MVGLDSLPFIGNDDDEDKRRDPSPESGVDKNRYISDDIDPLPYDPGTAQDELAESRLERIKAQPQIYLLYGGFIGALLVAALIFVVPFFPALTDPLAYIPLTLLAITCGSILYGMALERNRWSEYGIYVSRGEALFGELDRQRETFYPIRGWRFRGIKKNYLTVANIAPEIARRHNKSIEPDDRAAIRLPDEITELIRVPFFGGVVWASSPGLTIDEGGRDAVLRPSYPERPDTETVDDMIRALYRMRVALFEAGIEIDRLQEVRRNTETEMRKSQRETKDELIRDVSELLEDITISTQQPREGERALRGGFGQRRGDDDE